jgi:hypothetical protein
MASAINGCGTQIIPASQERVSNGKTQFDAIGVVSFFYCPLFPYRAFHAIDFQPEECDVGVHEQYQYQLIPLRMSLRLVAKAFMKSWAGCMFFMGGLMTLMTIFALFASVKQDHALLVFTGISAALLATGGVLKLGWLRLSRKDERIKDILGPHSGGYSDPYDWKSEAAEAVIEDIFANNSQSSLVDIAIQAIANGNHSDAMFCLRLAMRAPKNIEAQNLIDCLLAESESRKSEGETEWNAN